MITTRIVYYLEHKDTGRRLKWYRTLAGARIAQRQRNHRLGFLTRVKRIQEDTEHTSRELELCVCVDGTEQIATYTIVEDTVDSEHGLYID
jgi:hypothetical protein